MASRAAAGGGNSRRPGPRVLLLNDRGDLSGAEHSLLSLLASVRGVADVAVACPDGPLRGHVEALDLPWYESIWFTPGSRRRLRSLPHLAWAGAGAAWRVAGIVRRSGADIVHANSIRAGALACAAAPLHRRPVIIHVRDCVPRHLLGQAVRQVARFGATAIVANSIYVARCFLDQAVPVRKAVVIHNGVDLRRFSPDAIDPAATARLAGELFGSPEKPSPVLAVIGQITPWKGQMDAIHAFSWIRRAFPAARLLIVGSAKFTTATSRFDNTRYLAELQAAVQRLGLAGSVVFTGERSDVPDLLALTDVVLVPSWEEPFGRVIIESMALERPVVATSAGGPAEIIAPGQTGLLAPPKNPSALAAAALAILWSADQGRALGVRARLAVRDRFSAEAHAAAMMTLWRDVADGAFEGSIPATPQPTEGLAVLPAPALPARPRTPLAP